MAKLFKVKLDDVDSINIHGYRRSAWKSEEVNSGKLKCFFTFVMYQNENDKMDVLTEIIHNDISTGKTTHLDYAKMKEFLFRTYYGDRLVEVGGRCFIRSFTESNNENLKESIINKKIRGVELCRMTLAYNFAVLFPMDISIFVKWNDRIKQFEESNKIARLLNNIVTFRTMMSNDRQGHENRLKNAYEIMNMTKERIKRIEEKISSLYSEKEELESTMESYGVKSW